MQVTRETVSPFGIYTVINTEWSTHHNGARIPASIAVIAVGIVLKESGGDTGALNIVSSSNPAVNGSRDRGWWQFNTHWHPEISDSQAFDKVQSTTEAYRVSNGFTSWGAWFGSGANSITEEFNRNQHNQAAYRLASQTVGGGTDPNTNPSGNNAAEQAALNQWDTNGDGQLRRTDLTTPNDAAVALIPTSKVLPVINALKPHISGNTLTTGWLEDARAAARNTGEGWTTDQIDAIIKKQVIEIGSINTDSFLGQLTDPAEIAVGAVTGDIGGIISGIWSAVSNVSFWKRIGIAALGFFIIMAAIAVFLAKSDTVQKAAKGAAL